MGLKTLSYYPVALNLKNQTCLVIGGGKVAYRKVQVLLSCSAQVRLVAERIIPEIKTLARKYPNFRYSEKKYSIRDLTGCFLVIAATDNPQINTRAAGDAARKGLLINVVDNPGLCNFIVPAIYRQGGLTISISTGGISPALAKYIRQYLTQHFGGEYRAVLAGLKSVRQKIIRFPAKRKKAIWRKIINPRFLGRLKTKSQREVNDLIRTIIAATD